MRSRRRRRRRAVRPIAALPAYARLHGERGGDVTFVKIQPRRPRCWLRVSGEHVRRSVEEKLDARRPTTQGADGLQLDRRPPAR